MGRSAVLLPLQRMMLRRDDKQRPSRWSGCRVGLVPSAKSCCESAPKWDPGTFGHTGLIIHTKSGEGWGPNRRRSGPHSMLKLRATSIRYLELERGPSSVLIHTKVMRGNDGRLFIHSFAHGRGIYHLRHDARSAKAAVAQAPSDGLIDYAMSILASSEMEADELAEFAATVAKSAKISVRAVNARIAKERQERENAQRQAIMATGMDEGLIRPRPEPDGELTPIVTFLDQLLAQDQREEPPMRDASGKLVEIRVREPWALHLLTSDGANDDAEDAEAMKAPAEPGLEQLTPVGFEMLIERYVRWIVVKKETSYDGSLPRPYIDALMQLRPSSIPEVRAINTAPLISMSGRVIEGVGLDRDTRLVHRIDPLLRACLPADPPTKEAVRSSVTFLFVKTLRTMTPWKKSPSGRFFDAKRDSDGVTIGADRDPRLG
jgi:hypothetical protein